MNTVSFDLADEKATVDFGVKLAKALELPCVIYLEGDLGAGKTTLSRGIIQALGHSGNVKSPTYTLVEPYELDDVKIYHFDLYRLADPEELEYMGIRDYFLNDSLALIEWPERGIGMLAPADINMTMAYKGEARLVSMQSNSALGERIIAKLS